MDKSYLLPESNKQKLTKELIVAAKKGNMEEIERLIAAGADPFKIDGLGISALGYLQGVSPKKAEHIMRNLEMIGTAHN